MGIDVDICFDILVDIRFDILADICFDILADICFDILVDICPDGLGVGCQLGQEKEMVMLIIRNLIRYLG